MCVMRETKCNTHTCADNKRGMTAYLRKVIIPWYDFDAGTSFDQVANNVLLHSAVHCNDVNVSTICAHKGLCLAA